MVIRCGDSCIAAVVGRGPRYSIVVVCCRNLYVFVGVGWSSHCSAVSSVVIGAGSPYIIVGVGIPCHSVVVIRCGNLYVFVVDDWGSSGIVAIVVGGRNSRIFVVGNGSSGDVRAVVVGRGSHCSSTTSVSAGCSSISIVNGNIVDIAGRSFRTVVGGYNVLISFAEGAAGS